MTEPHLKLYIEPGHLGRDDAIRAAMDEFQRDTRTLGRLVRADLDSTKRWRVLLAPWKPAR